VRLAVVMAGACAAFGLVGCAPAGPATPALRPAAEIPGPVGASVDASAANAAKSGALKAYNAYFAAYVTASATADWNTKSFDNYSADPLRQQAHVKLRNLSNDHHVMTGKPGSHPVVTTLNVSSSPQTVLLSDCVDMADWTEVVRATGKPASATPPAHEAVSIVVINYPHDGWLVQQSNESKVSTC
jgi:hypothetical protein